MKRFLVSILAFLYLTASSGAMVHVHYCMGKMVDARVANHNKDADACGLCGMKKKANNGCCKDRYKLVKTEQSHTQAFKLLFGATKFIVSEPLHSFCNTGAPVYLDQPFASALTHVPPLKGPGVPIYLRVQNFRI